MGQPPFYSQDPQETYQKIVDFRDTLVFPENVSISPEAQDLILKLLDDESCRLGKNGAKEIKAHPFFQGIKWNQLQQTPTYFTPELQNRYDTQYFDKFEEEDPWYIPENNPQHLVNYKQENYDQYIFMDFEANYVLERELKDLNNQFLIDLQQPNCIQRILKSDK